MAQIYVTQLNNTFQSRSNTDLNEKQSEELKRYNKVFQKLADRVSKFDIPEEYRGNIEELENMKNITFVKDRENMEETLNTTMDALDHLYVVELHNLPSEYLAKLVRLLIALCKQGNLQIQSDISLIAQLDRDAFDFINAHEKLEAFKNYNAVLLDEVKVYKTEQKKHLDKIDELHEIVIVLMKSIRLVVILYVLRADGFKR